MDLLRRIDEVIAGRKLLAHPFYVEWTMGTLSRERLRDYAMQYYRHVDAFPRYLSALHSRCDDRQTRQALLENLIEEERGAENHPELWLRFAEALGVRREEVLAAPAKPTTKALVDGYDRIANEMPLPAGLAALYAYESQIPMVSTTKIEGLAKFYGISESRGIAFFRVHETADIYHSKTDADLLLKHCRTDADAEAAVAGAEAATQALWTMLDGV